MSLLGEGNNIFGFRWSLRHFRYAEGPSNTNCEDAFQGVLLPSLRIFSSQNIRDEDLVFLLLLFIAMSSAESARIWPLWILPYDFGFSLLATDVT